ncbi:short repeat uncharacterized protein predicted to be involved in signal transduction [Kitasatospora sp. SolWspMP-SS2h]|uniref:ALF repeat-containing protein n=1 Tax=Kitasatospora sp. SolWspMP-SS2h TaxID=1305729 RepID=UPI000DBA2434|nr:ALF repeat-containing protein [Kitasatospora sp. SolWspMP-SS2h]RAJ46276.1 short repeat uncharacterized protein predicted to be involved in signal transduction [Kitasatospora sp. SolWspMP-SS2h]
MSIRRSIAAAVFVAAVSAPTALGAAQAMAETAPTGQSQPDAAAPDIAAPDAAASDAAPTAPTAPTAPGESADPVQPSRPSAPVEKADPELDEAALRARLAELLAEPGHYAYYYQSVKNAQAGTAEQIRHFLDAELIVAIHDDNAIRTTQIMHEAGAGTPIWKAAQAVLTDGRPEAFEHFLHVTVPALTASDNRVKLSQFIADPVISAGLRAQALAVLEEGDSGAIADFLERAPGLRHTDYRAQVVQAMSVGGPEVRKAANAVLSADTPEALRDFLTKGLKEAQERDEAAGRQGGRPPGNGDSGAVRAGLTTGTTGTTTTTGTGTGGGTELASTGPGTPLGAVAATGAAAIVLGAGTLVATRRRRRES